MITRRQTLHLLGSVAGTCLLLRATPALAQGAPGGGSVSPAELAVAGPLGDQVQGAPDAKVTLIEYSSLTCPHCAAFHRDTYPQLKSRYIDTGKVRYILREFPTNALAAAGYILARCDGGTKYFPIVDLLFQQQRNWAFVDKPLDALQGLMRQAGFSQERFEACLRDKTLLDGVNAVAARGADKFKIESTPTFFINGQRHVGNLSIDELERILKPMLDT